MEGVLNFFLAQLNLGLSLGLLLLMRPALVHWLVGDGHRDLQCPGQPGKDSTPDLRGRERLA